MIDAVCSTTLPRPAQWLTDDAYICLQVQLFRASPERRLGIHCGPCAGIDGLPACHVYHLTVGGKWNMDAVECGLPSQQTLSNDRIIGLNGRLGCRPADLTTPLTVQLLLVRCIILDRRRSPRIGWQPSLRAHGPTCWSKRSRRPPPPTPLTLHGMSTTVRYGKEMSTAAYSLSRTDVVALRGRGPSAAATAHIATLVPSDSQPSVPIPAGATESTKTHGAYRQHTYVRGRGIHVQIPCVRWLPRFEPCISPLASDTRATYSTWFISSPGAPLSRRLRPGQTWSNASRA